MPADVAGDFSTTGGVAYVNGIFQVQLFREGCEVVRVRVHIVAIPCLGGTAMPSPVMRNDSIADLAEVQHLSFPIVGAERPAVAENDRLSRAPVLVINLRAVFRSDRRHKFLLRG